MKVSCSTLVFRLSEYPDIADNLAKIKEIGFTTVDVAAFQNWQNISTIQLAADRDYYLATVQKLKASGLDVASINSRYSVDIIDSDEEHFKVYCKEFEKVLQLAGDVGCRTITIQPGNLDTNPTLEESLALLERRAPIVGEMAKKRGIAVGMEGHQGSILENINVGLALVKKVYPLVGVTYDPSHYIMQGFTLEDTQPLLDYVVQVHYRNANFGNMQATMDDGEIDTEKFVQLLKEKKYDGVIAIEYFSGFDVGCANTLEIKKQLEELI